MAIEPIWWAQATILMALLQPAPEVYNLFDDIMLLAEGHIVYYGPKEEVRTLSRRLHMRVENIDLPRPCARV